MTLSKGTQEKIRTASNDGDYIPLIASIDVGTTSSRAILFNKMGQEIEKHQIEYSTSASKGKYSVLGKRRFSDESNETTEVPSNKPSTIFSAEGVTIRQTPNLEIEDLLLNQSASTTAAHLSMSGPTLEFPKPGWIQCNPMALLANVVQCLGSTLVSLSDLNKDRIKKSFPPYKIGCIGITNMRETTLVWSKSTGLPIINYGIVWNDTRNLPLIRTLQETVSNETAKKITKKTGLPLFSTYFSCSKLKWLLENEPLVQKAYQEKDLMFGTVDTWLLYNLTVEKAFVSDITNASRTGFMDLNSLDYDDELLSFWRIDPKLVHLPKIVSCSEYYGQLTIPEFTKNLLSTEIWEELNRFKNSRVPIQGCIGDQSASLVGQLAFKTGSAKCTYGTGCFLLYNTGTEKMISEHGALTTPAYWFPNSTEQPEPHFALEGSIAVGGSVVQWLRDNLRLIPKSEHIGPLASRVRDSGGVVFVPAFNGLFAPYWDPDTRATIMGISQSTTASHIARAAIEGVCFQVRAILKAMGSDEVYGDSAYEKKNLATLAVDGGMSKSNEVMQIQADILGPCIKLRRSPIVECTALGAAIAANMAYKKEAERILWKDLNDVKKWIMYNGYDKDEGMPTIMHDNLAVFKSSIDDAERRKHWKLWQVAVKRSRGWLTDVDGEHEDVLEP